MCGADCIEVFSYMYVGFSGNSHVCKRVSVETVAYVRGS
jgi:hypothetical protein